MAKLKVLNFQRAPIALVIMPNFKIFCSIVLRIFICILPSLIHKWINVFLMSKEF